MEKPAKSRKKGNLTIYIFPYLFVDKEFDLEGHKLKPSYKEIFDKEPKRVKGHLARIARSFKLPTTNNISQYTYGWTTLHTKQEWIDLKKFLDTFSTLIRYEELSDERGGASYSNFDYAVFEIYKPMSNRKYDYYEGVLNGRNTIRIHYPQTKYCPNFDIRPYLLPTDKSSSALTHLLYLSESYHSSDEKTRLIRAIEWFNKSFKSDPEIDDLEKLISLAIAFEALSNSPPEGIQAAIASNITSLLGESPEMVHWVKDFYEQRSKIVHGKEEPTVLYKGKSASQSHLNHLAFARKVFVLCLKAIFLSRENVYTKGLRQELISNEIRIKEVLKTLNSKKTIIELYQSKIFDTLDSFSHKDLTGNISDVLKIGQLLLPKVDSILTKHNRSDLNAKLKEIVDYKDTDLGKLGVMYSDFHSEFSSVYFGDKTIKANEIHFLALKGAVYNFSSYAGWRLLAEAFNHKK